MRLYVPESFRLPRQGSQILSRRSRVRVVSDVLLIGVAALPTGMGVAILKYRLYEIDRIVSRTVAYAIVTGLLVGVYAGLVLLATRVLSVSSPVAVAASTLAAAALFAALQPAHVSVWINQRG